MGSCKLIIKPLRASEITDTVILVEYYRDEANLPEGEYDQDAVIESMKNFTINPNYFWVNGYDNGRPVGFIAGYLCPIPWSKHMTAHIQFIYMLPNYRNLVNGKQLVNEFETWAKALGAVRISAGDIGIDTERTRTFYQQLEFADTGCWLTKEIKV